MGITQPPAPDPTQDNPPPTTASPDPRKQAIDFAADATKQLITIAAGIITATVIFSKDLTPPSRYWALAGWVALMVSVLGGLAVLFIMTGKLKSFADHARPLEIDYEITDPSKIQWIAFLLGLALMIVFGFVAAGSKQPPLDTKPLAITCMVPAPVVTVTPAPVSQEKQIAKRDSHKNQKKRKR